MSLFCFFWVPLFYLFWRSVASGGSSGWAWALLMGSMVGIVKFFNVQLVDPGGFGFSRWASGFVDIIVLPALAPLLVYLLFFFLKIVTDAANFASFALIWLIPVAAVRAVAWSAQGDPVLLILVPILWTAIAVGIPFFITLIMTFSRPGLIALFSFAILCIPVSAATSYWAFFSHRAPLGFLFLFIATAPMIVSVVLSSIRSESG